MKHEEVAKWLYDRIKSKGSVYQYDIAREISDKFGKEYTPITENGGRTLHHRIKYHFKKLKGNDVEWDNTNKLWRWKTDFEKESEEMVKVEPIELNNDFELK